MKVNTLVVRALMALRLMDVHAIAHTLQLPLSGLSRWLYDEDGDAVPYARQLEVLTLLGIDRSAPRSDVVHHWTITEPWFATTARVYWAIDVMTRAFGRAQVVFVAPEADPAFAFKSVAHFCLRFDGFYALLEVHGPALRSLRFDPATVPGLSWSPEDLGLLLEHNRLAELQPGAMSVERLAHDVSIPQEMLKWERLSKLAASSGLRPEELAKWVVAQNPHLALSSSAPSDEPASPEIGDESDALFSADEAPAAESLGDAAPHPGGDAADLLGVKSPPLGAPAALADARPSFLSRHASSR